MSSVPQTVPVAHVVTGLNVGGLERVVVNLARGFQGSRFQSLVVCLEDGGEFVPELEALGVPVIVLGKKPGIDWGAIRRLARLFRSHQVRIVHTHNPTPHFHGLLAARLARVPVRIHTKHGRNYPEDRRKVALNRLLSWFTDVIVPVSDNARDVALQLEHVNPRKLRRIWNGVDTDSYRPSSLSPTLGTRPPTIGTVARLDPDKDQANMLAAFRIVIGEIPSARLVFAGGGPCEAALHETAARLGVGNSVDFLGMRSDIPAVLNGFDLFTLSSVTEGISMTILEAMACSLPIVATDVGGNREIVQPPACGLIVPPRDPRALADAWLELLRDPARRQQMGSAARQRVVEHFSLRAMVQQYAQVYEQLLAAKQS